MQAVADPPAERDQTGEGNSAVSGVLMARKGETCIKITPGGAGLKQMILMIK